MKGLCIKHWTNRMVLSVPITNQNCDIPIRSIKRNRNYSPVINYEAPKTTRRPLEIEGREVKETPNLVLNLKSVSPIPLWRNWTISSKDPILPRTPPLENARPVSPPTKIFSNRH